MSVAQRSYRTGDCLYAIYLDLASVARTLPLWDADAREQWLDAAGWLLAQVPCESQRVSWAYQLAVAWTHGGTVLGPVVQELWRRAGGRL